MSNEEVCDSWETLIDQVDKIQIKPKKKNPANVTRSYATAAARPEKEGDAFNNADQLTEDNGPSAWNGATSSTSSASSVQVLARPADRKIIPIIINDPTTLPTFLANQPQIELENPNTGASQCVTKLRIMTRPNSRTNENVNSNNSGAMTAEDIREKLRRRHEEKQAEYLKARLRILGEELPKEELVFDEDHTLVSSRTTTTRSSPLLPTPKAPQQPLPILRQPKAPDGTCGFGKL